MLFIDVIYYNTDFIYTIYVYIDIVSILIQLRNLKRFLGLPMITK